MAQLSLSPSPWQTFWTDLGVIASGHLLFTYAAGTADKLATYSDVGGLVAHTNPIVLDAAGRVPGGFFLLPASYKMILAPPTDSDPPSAPIRTQDHIGGVPTNNIDNDVIIVAGEALTANEVAYLSDGSGGLTAGRWYRADADQPYSSTLPQVGLVVADVALGASGTARLSGRVAGFVGLTAGAAYYISATTGGITPTPPSNSRFLGQADSITSLIVTPTSPGFVGGYDYLQLQVFA